MEDWSTGLNISDGFYTNTSKTKRRKHFARCNLKRKEVKRLENTHEKGIHIFPEDENTRLVIIDDTGRTEQLITPDMVRENVPDLNFLKGELTKIRILTEENAEVAEITNNTATAASGYKIKLTPKYDDD